MSKILRYVRLIVPAVLTISFAPAALAVACTSVATGNWNAQATWGAAGTGCAGAVGGIPGAADTVTIAAAHTVTVTANAAATSITVAAPSVAAHGININPGIVLNVSGAITLAAPAANGRTSTLAVGSGTLNAASIAINGGTSATRISQVTVSTGTLTTTGSITSGGTAAQARFVSTGASMVNVGGNFLPGALATTATGTINFNGAAAQTMGAFTTYNNVTVSKAAGALSLLGNTSMTGALTVASGTLAKGTRTLGVAGNLAVNGAITGTSGNITLSGAGATIDGAGSITTTTGVLSITTAKNILATANLTIASPVTLAANVTVTNNGTVNKTTTTALNGANATTSIWVNAANSTLNYAGTNAPMVTGVLNASAVGNTVNYTGAAQAIETPALNTYHHLGLSGSGAKTAAAGLVVNGNFTLSGTATFTAGTFTHDFAGNWIIDTTAAAPLSVATTSVINVNTPALPAPTSMSGTTVATIAFADVNINNTSGVTFNNNASFSTGTTPTLTVATGATLTPAAGVIISGTGTLTGTGTVQVTRTAATADFSSQYSIATKTLTNLTVEYIGAAAQTVSALTYGSTTGGGLKANNASGVSLTASTTVAGTLTLESGVVNAGVFTLIGSGDCTTRMLRNSGHVAGNLQLQFPTGAPSCTFHVGDATTYRPVTAAFTSVTAAGPLVGAVSQAAGDHPSIASSGLDAAKSVNRYWTITDPVGGTIAYTTYSATFNFFAGDYDGGATPGNFEAEFWNGAVWTATTVGTQAATSNQANGIASPSVANSYAAFAVAEKIPPPAVVSIIRADANPTSVATVSWTVTFSKSVTGVDATDFALAATGVSGAFVSTVTGSGTTWAVTANTGIGSGTLGLNLTDDDTIVDAGGHKLGGTGAGNGSFTGEVYTVTATPALAEYRMGEAAWNGTANEVVDSSGSGNHAQAFNSASTDNASSALMGDPGTCRYGVFDNGTTITQGYVQTPLGNLTSDFTITAWIRTTNNTVTGQRILIDDQGVAPGTGYGFSLGDGAAGRLRFYSRGITPISFDSTYTVANNVWYFVASVVDFTSKKRSIYVFDTSGTLLGSDVEAAAWTGIWGTDGGPVSIGAETNASAELPATFHFRGNLDEVRVYQKVLSQNALAAIAAQRHICPVNVPDHLEIQHPSGAGLTCAASTLTIKACADASCSSLFTGGVSGTLSVSGASTVNWDGTTGGAVGAGFAIPNGSSSVTKDVQVATAGSVVFGITSPSPLPASATTCNFGVPSCTFTADTAGFIFSDSATGSNPYTIPSQTSGSAQNTDNLLWLRAVQASTANAAVCTPAIIGQTITVSMGYTCSDPNTCSAGSLGVINGTTIAPSGTNVSLAFDANGSAKITSMRYDDVGQIALTADKTLTPFGGATPIALNGSSNTFVVKPHHFDLSGIQRTSDSLANPGSANATGAAFVKAGESFTVTVTARNALDAATPNYGQESAAESVKLTPALAAGLGLTSNPAIGGVFGAFANGVATGAAFTWNEAGIITLTPSVGDGDYLGAGDVTGTSSGNVGRFYAAQFTLSGGIIANRTGLGGVCAAPAGCDAFTYMGEQMSAVFSLIAKATDGATTLQNYTYSATPANNFARLDLAASGNPLVLGAVDTGTPRTVVTLDTTTHGAASGSFSVGVASVTAPFAVTRDASPSGPFDALEVGIAPVDSDGAALAVLDLAVNAGGTPNTHGKVGSTKARYGRMKLSNAHGSELLKLPVGVTAQYWDGTTYITNALDNSSTFAAGDLIFSNWQKLTPSSTWAAGSTSVATPPASVVFAGGTGGFILAKPGANKTGSVDMTVNILSAYLPSNTGRATFGVYKGNNEFIYLRENY